jgi:hypothetical protein
MGTDSDNRQQQTGTRRMNLSSEHSQGAFLKAQQLFWSHCADQIDSLSSKQRVGSAVAPTWRVVLLFASSLWLPPSAPPTLIPHSPSSLPLSSTSPQPSPHLSSAPCFLHNDTGFPVQTKASSRLVSPPLRRIVSDPLPFSNSHPATCCAAQLPAHQVLSAANCIDKDLQ